MSSFDSDNVYADEYYDSLLGQPRLYNETQGIAEDFSQNWINFTRIGLGILLRVGLILLQIGSVPTDNVNLILLQNIVDICCVTVIYLLIGYMVAYNHYTSFIGKDEFLWIARSNTDQNDKDNKMIIGWQAITTASGISTCGIAGRTHTVGYLVIGIVLSGLVQPLLINWAWMAKGWMLNVQIFDRRVHFRDYAGSGIVHVIGGLSGLIGCMTLGRRMLRLKDIDNGSVVASNSSATTFAGQLLIFIGLQGLCLPNLEQYGSKFTNEGKRLSNALINNLLAASSCSLIVVALHFILIREPFNHWTVLRCAQGVIAGLVTVSAGANAYSPLMSIGLGCASGIMFYFVSRFMFDSALEDYCNIVATHLSCGVLGSLLAPLCIFDNTSIRGIMLDFTWQIICMITLIIIVVAVMSSLFILLERRGMLRNKSECINHLRSKKILDGASFHTPFMKRIYTPNEHTTYLEPGYSVDSNHSEPHDSKELEEMQPSVELNVVNNDTPPREDTKDKVRVTKNIDSGPEYLVNTSNENPTFDFNKELTVYTNYLSKRDNSNSNHSVESQTNTGEKVCYRLRRTRNSLDLCNDMKMQETNIKLTMDVNNSNPPNAVRCERHF